MSKRWGVVRGAVVLGTLGMLAACRSQPASPLAQIQPLPSSAAPTLTPQPSPTSVFAPTATPTLAPTHATVVGVWEPVLSGVEGSRPRISASPSPTQTPSPRLLIPALDLDRPIETVGFRNGEWDLDTLDENVGWLTTTGERPGGSLAMAFTGHVSRRSGTSGPFGYLWKLKPGAEIFYRLGAVDYVYVLESKTALAPTDTRALYEPDGTVLFLLTCDGWSFTDSVYTQRLLVRAILKEQRPTEP